MRPVDLPQSVIVSIINPQRARAARVTVLGLCVCGVCVCVSVTFHVIICATNDTNVLSGG